MNSLICRGTCLCECSAIWFSAGANSKIAWWATAQTWWNRIGVDGLLLLDFIESLSKKAMVGWTLPAESGLLLQQKKTSKVENPVISRRIQSHTIKIWVGDRSSQKHKNKGIWPGYKYVDTKRTVTFQWSVTPHCFQIWRPSSQYKKERAGYKIFHFYGKMLIRTNLETKYLKPL